MISRHFGREARKGSKEQTLVNVRYQQSDGEHILRSITMTQQNNPDRDPQHQQNNPKPGQGGQQQGGQRPDQKPGQGGQQQGGQHQGGQQGGQKQGDMNR